MESQQTQHKVSEFLADRHPYYPEDHEHIFQSEVHKHEVRPAFDRRVVTKLRDVLRFDEATEDEIVQALVILVNRISNQERKAEAVREGVVQACAHLMSHASARVRCNSALVLGRLGQLASAREAMRGCGVVTALSSGCMDDSLDVRTQCAAAVHELGRHRDGWELLVHTEGALQTMVDALDINAATISAFTHISAHFYEGAEEALACGVMRRVSSLLGSCDETVLVRDACQTVRNLANNEAGKRAAIDAEAVKAVARHLTHADDDVRVAATGALATLVLALPARHQFMGIGPAAVAALCERLRDEVPHACRNALLTIRHLSELPSARTVFVRELVQDSELIMTVFAAQACKDLCGILKDGTCSTEAKAAALLALGAIVGSGREGLETAVQTLHLVREVTRTLATVDMGRAATDAGVVALRSLVMAYPDALRVAKAGLESEYADGLKTVLRTHSDLATLLL
jgi:hypothetical protein